MGRVRVGFFDAQTRPAGPPLLPRPGPFNKWFFFSSKPASSGVHRPRPATSGPNPRPNPTQSY